MLTSQSFRIGAQRGVLLVLVGVPMICGFPALAAAAQSFEIYGAVQADYIQDFNRVDPDWTSTLRPSKIPTDDGFYGSDGQAILSAKQSRFGVKSTLPVEGGV